MSPTSPSPTANDTDEEFRASSDQISSSDFRQMSGSMASTSKKSCGGLDWESAFASEVTYCLFSAGTVLINKHALSSFAFPAPNTLLLFQFVLACILLKILNITGVLNLQPIRWEVVKLWLPCNLIFVAMNVTGFYALQDVGAGEMHAWAWVHVLTAHDTCGVCWSHQHNLLSTPTCSPLAGMFTVLKNMSNLMTIVGDYVIYGNTYSWQVRTQTLIHRLTTCQHCDAMPDMSATANLKLTLCMWFKQVWLTLGLMVLSAVMGGWTDITFSMSGYTWQLINCCFTAAYSLYLGGVIKRLTRDKHSKHHLSEMSMVSNLP